jgi:iron-sulfur cluster assembly accessory protein
MEPSLRRVLQSPGARAARLLRYDAFMEIAEQPTITPLMSVTDAAAAKIRQLMAEEDDVNVLRVAIQGGGCSGFQYGLGFDRGSQEGDVEFEAAGVPVVVDPFSAPYLQGAEIDYVDSIQAAGFAINNPNASSSCGCGHSFQVEEGAEVEGHSAGCGSGCSH